MKRESLSEQLKDLGRLNKASRKRQVGKNTTSEDIKTREGRKATLKSSPDGRPYFGPAYGSGMPKGKSKEAGNKPVSKPSRKPTGREEMIAQRFLERRKKESNVVS